MEENCRGNNKHPGCTQRMADGRNFTDYRPRCISNFADFTPDADMNSYDYRQYLQSNCGKILEKIRKDVYNANRCGPCLKPYNIGTMLPEKNEVTCNKSTCSVNSKDTNGLGTGRNYNEISPLNKEFVDMKEEEQSYSSCVLTHDDPLFFAYNKEMQKCERAFKPSGNLPLCQGDEDK